MKTPATLLLAASLAVNAVGAWLLLRSSPAADGRPANSSGTTGKSAPRDATPSDVWKQFDTSDLGAFTQQLRDTGFPPELVRALVAAQLDASYAARRKALLDPSGSGEFWKTPLPDPRVQAELRALNREQQKRLGELTGDPQVFDPLTGWRGMSFLAPAKATELQRVLSEFGERRAELYAAGVPLAADREKLKALEQQQRAAIAQVLSPEELFEYDLRTSNTAESMRQQLSAFQPTEQEFREIYKLRAAFDERFNLNDGSLIFADNQRMRARSEAEQLLNRQILATLDPQRAADYPRMSDYNYVRTAQLVSRLELPAQTTDQLYAMQKEFEQRRAEIYQRLGAAGGTPPNREQITAQLTALQQEAIARVAPLLGGPNRVETYRQYGGAWLANMVPRPPPTRAVPGGGGGGGVIR